MERKDGQATFYPSSPDAWRQGLLDNHATEKNIWLILYRKGSGVPSLSYNEAVDVALCFGWIDSTPNKRDEQSFYQFFSRRNPKSKWSRVNKEKIERLSAAGLMHPAGIAAVELARENGAWTALDEVENLTIPTDLEAALDANPQAKSFFEAFPRSVKRGILEWISNAKQAETRRKRIEETVTLAAQNIRANQYVKKT
ncbi:MAG: YdeI/OmpD-associated family protein [Saprospiraceae bacterium]|nr:YdeI/OmpD-associated family protein [Saprospiraceae bacterium]